MRLTILKVILLAYLTVSGNALLASDKSLLQSIERLIHTGHIDSAETRLNNLLTDTTLSKILKTELYTLSGNIQKIRGDIEKALHFWEKSNALRSQLYPSFDYHLAWNYALLSNYHYEKIHTLQAKAYADSCRALITELTTEQQLEIEIYRIWNILAQSDKQQAGYDGHDNHNWYAVYTKIWTQYEHSVEFQLIHGTPRHHLAKTYHLLGNAYQDIIPWMYEIPENTKEGYRIFATAHHNYDKALDIWSELYGKNHYQAALTHFVQAMSYWKILIEKHPEKYPDSNRHFEKALNAWGMNDTITKKLLRDIPNKINLLMCLKVYSENLIYAFHRTENRDYFDRVVELNEHAISLWEIIYETFTSGHTNQFLATYQLIPYNITYYIELEKQRLGIDYSLEKMFAANQRLKYFDLIRHSV